MNNVEAMTPMQPGAYVAVFEDEKSDKFRIEPVVAIAAYRTEGGWIEFEPVSVLGGYKMRTPPGPLDSSETYHGMFAPDEVETYISEMRAQRAQYGKKETRHE